MKRMPARAGSFYPADPDELRKTVARCFQDTTLGPGVLPVVQSNGPRRIFGLVCPHAGYMYSGYAAARSYQQLALDGRPETVVLIGPNHYGYGKPLAVYSQGSWLTPLGEVDIDENLAHELIRNSDVLAPDESAHLAEHSLEVQIPFLQYLYESDFKIVPIIASVSDLPIAMELGGAIARIITKRNAVVIASTDLSHDETHDEAVRKDSKAIEAMLRLDSVGLAEAVYEHQIRMCGVVPVASLLEAAHLTGNLSARLLGYNTSGDVIGDKRRVVGYASVMISREV